MNLPEQTANIVDKETGELLLAYIFVATLCHAAGLVKTKTVSLDDTISIGYFDFYLVDGTARGHIFLSQQYNC